MITSLEDDVQRRTRWVAGIVVTTALLGACSEKQEGNDTLPSASETSSSAELQPLGPPDFPVPDEARTQDAAGAKAFVEYYIELTNFLLPSLESAPLRELSQNCETCESLADGYDSSRAAGYRYEGGRLTITSAGEPTVDGNKAEIAFVLQQEAVSVLDASGTLVPDKSGPAYPLSGGASLMWDARLNCWVVTQLTADAQ